VGVLKLNSMNADLKVDRGAFGSFLDMFVALALFDFVRKTI
jgi:hypothetical protein